jgi:predicted enzyme related to lactoylglutathione lyase
MAKHGIGWLDLTVDRAESVKDFYAKVTGLEPQPVSMGEYDDFNMNLPGGTPAAGICHRRGPNARIPAGWIVYFNVPDLEAALRAVEAGGGKVLLRSAGGPMAFAQDPSGATFALYQSPE